MRVYHNMLGPMNRFLREAGTRLRDRGFKAEGLKPLEEIREALGHEAVPVVAWRAGGIEGISVNDYGYYEEEAYNIAVEGRPNSPDLERVIPVFESKVGSWMLELKTSQLHFTLHQAGLEPDVILASHRLSVSAHSSVAGGHRPTSLSFEEVVGELGRRLHDDSAGDHKVVAYVRLVKVLHFHYADPGVIPSTKRVLGWMKL